MKKAELEQELVKRNLSTAGLKKDFQDRLYKAMKKELMAGGIEEAREAGAQKVDTAPPVVHSEAPKQTENAIEAKKEKRQSVVMADVIDTAEAMRISSDEEAMRISLVDEKKDAEPMPAEVNEFDNAAARENVNPVDSSSKKTSPKRSRSPMKKVQHMVKMLSSSKSPRSMYANSKAQSESRSPLLQCTEEPVSSHEDHQTKGMYNSTTRTLQPLKAPENGSLSKSAGSAIKSKSVLAKNQERIDKIRSQKKAALGTSKHQPSVTSNYIANLTSLSKNRTANDGNSRLIDQMRAKNAATGVPTESFKLGAFKLPNRVGGLSKMGQASSSTKKVKQPEILSPMSTYSLSDKEESESEYDSDDSYAAAKHSKKKIPSWATKEKLMPKVEAQFRLGGLDPDEIFGEVETCDLEKIFDRRKTRYAKRTSSGNWCRDRATKAEKSAYRRNMQYLGGGVAL